MSNPNASPVRRVVYAALAGAILYGGYDFANYNDTPGHFVDLKNPGQLLAAPIGDVQFIYNNFETVADVVGGVGTNVFKAGSKIVGFAS